jgi:hypothetical protein
MMRGHPDFDYQLVTMFLGEALEEAARERRADQARRASPDFVPSSRWRDPAFWSTVFGSIVGLGFLSYFAVVIAALVQA